MKNIARAGIAAFALVLLAACGGTSQDASQDASQDTSQDTSTENHNEADVSFAQEMIPHHGQALMMAGLAETNDAGPEVADLAARIEKAQDPEIEQMAGWLEEWGKDSGHDGMDGMDDMEGMEPGDIRDLTRARGAKFDTVFLTQMIEHHESAVEMAKREQSEGRYPDAVTLARSIEKSQQAEIEEMRTLLAG